MSHMLGRQRSGHHDLLPRWDAGSTGPESSGPSFLAPLLRSVTEENSSSLVEQNVDGAPTCSSVIPSTPCQRVCYFFLHGF